MKLTIEKYGFTVTIEGPDSGSVGEIGYFMDSLVPKPTLTLAEISKQADVLFNNELKKVRTPAKKRGRPAGSRNKK
jgi:hypothetical protein